MLQMFGVGSYPGQSVGAEKYALGFRGTDQIFTKHHFIDISLRHGMIRTHFYDGYISNKHSIG